MAQRGDEVARVAARRVAVADTTAAGDFFAAGFLHAYSREADLERCLECGALLAEHVIQVVGTRLPEATWTELNTKIQDILK
jgi:sugar/nucleoside kinase (ribokinase family)